MARIVPDDWKNLEATGAAVRELETLSLLEKLPDDYTVYHGVHWTRINEGFSVFGEADFVVVAPSGRVLIIEQKAGFLRETGPGLVKVYLQKERNVAIQLARTLENLHRRFTAAFGAGTYRIEELLYCPDYTVKDASIAGVPAARIVDASRKAQARCASCWKSFRPTNRASIRRRASIIFSPMNSRSRPTPTRSSAQADMLVTRLSGGLATWARRLEFEPFRLRVIAHGGLGQDAARRAGDARRGREGQERARTSASTGRSPITSARRAARGEDRELPSVERGGRARCRQPARFQPAERVRDARRALRRTCRCRSTGKSTC